MAATIKLNTNGVNLRMYDINSQKWKWLGDWEAL